MNQENLKLDYTIKDINKRKEIVSRILQNTENRSPQFLDRLSDYIIHNMSKEEKRNKEILTDNRLVTVNKRETSYQGLVSKLENGEDGIYLLLDESLGKNTILTPKVSITEKDIETVPGLKALREAIAQLEKQEKKVTGKAKYLIKKQIIEMRQDQYVLKNAFNAPMFPQKLTKSISKIDLSENFSIDAEGNIKSDGLITLINPKHVSAILCNYSLLKQETEKKIFSDLKDILEDLDKLIDKTLKENYPFYYDLVRLKIEGMRNIDIQAALKEQHGFTYTVEYLSALWRNKIPKLIAEQAEEDALLWYYTMVEKGKWKKCSRCGEIKLAHSKFFSKNKSSSDGWYSVCKCCRKRK